MKAFLSRLGGWGTLPWVALGVALVVVVCFGVRALLAGAKSNALKSAEASAEAAAAGRTAQEGATEKLREVEARAAQDRERILAEGEVAEQAVDDALNTSLEALRDTWEKAMGR